MMGKFCNFVLASMLMTSCNRINDHLSAEAGTYKAGSDIGTFTSGKGRLIPEPGSDSSVMLVELQRALQAKTHLSLPR